MKTVIFGSGGQLGTALTHTCPGDADLVGLTSRECDITDKDAVASVVQKERPGWIINAAAYTDVDKAEKERSRAFKINCDGVRHLGEACRRSGARLVHISTDYVFSGKTHVPYRPADKPAPRSVYGESKLAGETAALDILGTDALIIRTAWLYASAGRNFVVTMLKLMKEKKSLTVVDDQVGTPTWSGALAEAVWAAVGNDLKGVFHFTDAGAATWYDFAVAIQEEALAAGILSTEIPITPVSSAEYKTAAERPAYTLLDKRDLLRLTGARPVHWRRHLRKMIREYAGKTAG